LRKTERVQAIDEMAVKQDSVSVDTDGHSGEIRLKHIVHLPKFDFTFELRRTLIDVAGLVDLGWKARQGSLLTTEACRLVLFMSRMSRFQDSLFKK